MRVPLGHQTAAVARFSNEDRAAMFLDMRLGKSYTTILWARKRGYKRILLVAPATPLIDWVTELEREGNLVRMVSGSPPKREAVLAEPGEGWFLITYGSLTRTPGVLQQWDLIILDESTTIKNPKSGVTKFCLQRLHGCTRARAVLSGLPSPQDDMELWCQLAWASPDKRWLGFSNYWKFRETFCKQIGFSWELKFTHRPILRKALHEDAFVMSRKDAGLPNIKQYRRIVQPLNPEAEAAMQHLIENWEIDGLEVKYAPQIAGISHRLAGGFSPGRIYPCWKYGETHRLLAKEFVGEKVVLWFAYNPELYRMRSWLESKGYKCSILIGTMPRAARKQAIESFRSGDKQVFLGQVACGKFGLDLSIADVEIYVSCPYSYEGRRQSEERVIHPTKKRDTLVLDLVSSGSADEAVQETLRDRKSSATYFLSRFSKLFKLREPTGAASTPVSAERE